LRVFYIPRNADIDNIKNHLDTCLALK